MEPDAMAASICLLAWIVSHEGALQRYYSWLIKTGVLKEPDIPALGEYREHLRATLDNYVAAYGRELAVVA